MSEGLRPGRLLPLIDDGYPVDRRAFIADLLKAGALATVVAACGGGGGEPTNPLPEPVPGTPPNLDVTVALASQPVLANVNGVARIGSGRNGFFLVRTATDSFRALSFVCPHQGTTNQWSVTGSGASQRLVCGNHGSEFDLAGAPQNAVTRNGMRRFQADFNAAAGTVRVTGFI